MEEIWKPVKDYEGLYEVSNMGRVKSLNREFLCSNGQIKKNKEKILTPRDNGRGYLNVHLTKDGCHKHLYVHRLVAEAFIPNPENKKEIDHINTIKTDNRVENLRWVTRYENCNNPLTKEKIKNNHADISGKNHPCYGKYNNNGKKIVQLSEKGELIKIWNSGMEIKRELGYDPSYISKCCNKKKDMCHGYKWIFYEEYVEKIN